MLNTVYSCYWKATYCWYKAPNTIISSNNVITFNYNIYQFSSGADHTRGGCQENSLVMKGRLLRSYLCVLQVTCFSRGCMGLCLLCAPGSICCSALQNQFLCFSLVIAFLAKLVRSICLLCFNEFLLVRINDIKTWLKTCQFFSRPSPKAGRELQTVLNRMMEDEDEEKDP